MTDEVDIENIQEKLAHWFVSQLPHAMEIELSSLKKPGAGTSNQTFLFDLRLKDGGNAVVEKLVIRLPPKGFTLFPKDAYDMAKQYNLMKLLGETVVPVPRVRWLEEDISFLGVPFFIMEQVSGWIPSDFPPYHLAGPLFEAASDEKEKIWWSVVDTIANIHTLDWRKVGSVLEVPKRDKEFIERQIAYYEEIFQLNNEPLPPILATTRDWLLANSFAPKHVSLCWGDARLGNIFIRDHEVAAVLDWEMAFIGDPEADLGWFAHMDWATSVGRPVSPSPRLAGLPGIQETIAHYEQVAGRKVENFHYYEVFAVWRMAILFTRMEQDEQYLSRSKNSKGFINWTHYEKLNKLLGLQGGV